MRYFLDTCVLSELVKTKRDNNVVDWFEKRKPHKLYNCAPLSFLDVDRTDYATAMLGVYEQRNVSAAVELFESIYRRSSQKYSVLRASLGLPDPIRARYRTTLNELMTLVVCHSQTLEDAGRPR